MIITQTRATELLVGDKALVMRFNAESGERIADATEWGAGPDETWAKVRDDDGQRYVILQRLDIDSVDHVALKS